MKKTIITLMITILCLLTVGCENNNEKKPNPDINKKGETEAMVNDSYTFVKNSENTALKDLMEGKTFSTSIKGKSYNLLYRIYVPENYNGEIYKYPLVVYFHGYGECGNNNLNQLSLDFDFLPRILNAENLKKYPAIVIAPQCPIGEVWATKSYETFNSGYDINTTSINPSMLATVKLIDSLKENYNIDDNRVYVTGVSMGGLATWDIAARYPELAAAILPVCGAAMPIKNPTNFQNINVWAFHGEKDPTITVNTSKSMVNAINQNGGHAIGTFYPDADHTLCWKKAYVEENFLDFMFISRKGTINKYFN